MLIKILLAVVFLSIPTKPELIEPELIEFKKDNFVSLRETINQGSSSKLLSKLNLIENKHNTIYLYINSPGGDVMAGLEIINYIKSLQDIRNKAAHAPLDLKSNKISKEDIFIMLKNFVSILEEMMAIYLLVKNKNF